MVLVGSGLAIAPAATAGGEVRQEEHCVVRVVGIKPSGELITTKPECSTTRAAAMARATQRGQLSSFAIGIHFDGASFTGDTFTVVGDDCTGGWLNLSAAWINRVSSTLHGCPRIRHFDGYNLTSSFQTTNWPGGNLTALNNATNSIQYLP